MTAILNQVGDNMQVLVINNQYSCYGVDYDNAVLLAELINSGKEIWFEYTSSAKIGSIGRVSNTESIVNVSNRIAVLTSFDVKIGDKIFRVVPKSYSNNFRFIVDYTNGPVYKFTKNVSPKVLESSYKDMMGNSISIDDWVIYHAKGSAKPSLGKITRFSKANNAWASGIDRHGNTIEVMTAGCLGLIKVHIDEAVNNAYQLCGSFDGLPCRLTLELAT